MGGLWLDSRLQNLLIGPSACVEKSCTECPRGVSRRKRGKEDRQALCLHFLFLFSPQRDGSARQGRGQVAGDLTDPSSLLHTVFTHFLHL